MGFPMSECLLTTGVILELLGEWCPLCFPFTQSNVKESEV